jgi:cytochrome c-type biogenesis protein CcmH
MVFWIAALVLGALAAAFVLWPLRGGRDDAAARQVRARSNLAIFGDRQAELEADLAEGRIGEAEFTSLEAELKRSLLRDVDPEELDAAAPDEPPVRTGRSALLAAAVLVPLTAVVLYADWGFSLGAQAELALAEDVRTLDAPSQGAEHEGEMGDLAARLEARLAEDPEDPDGWFLLGRTRLNQGDFEGAAEAFGRVAALADGAPAPLVFRAQALYLAEDRAVTPRVREAIDAALAVAPGQPIMLEILGMDAFQSGRFAEAAERFERVLATEIRDPARRDFLEDGLARARELAGLPPAEAPGAAEPADGPAIDVEVTIPPEALADLPASAAVFVLARAVDGPPMPLAVERHAPAPSLRVRLTPEDAMTPAMSIAGRETVEVVARLSRSGTAAPGPDDLEATAAPVRPGDRPRVRLALGDGAPAPEIVAGDPAGAGEARPSAAPAPASRPAPGGAPGEARVRVLVEADPSVRVPPGATLFVFAREVGGPPMPLAVARLGADELPTVVTLDDSQAMVAGRGLSAADRVQIVARVSASGGVAPQSGDLEGATEPLDPRTAERVVPLLIDRTIP